MSAAAARQCSASFSSPLASASLAPRSAATQHITLDAVKCRGSPRISQMPRSGSGQISSAFSASWQMFFQAIGPISVAAFSKYIAAASMAIPQTSC